MSTRVLGPIVIKHGPAPAARGRRGREQKWAPVYRAIDTLKPGEWFVVPGLEKATGVQRTACVAAIRKWIAAHGMVGDIEVYRDTDDTIVVKASGSGS